MMRVGAEVPEQKIERRMGDFVKQMQGYRLTTAEILYHMPDHPNLLQTFIWQEMDLAPRFPVLCRFLDFWSHKLDGKLHSVRVACTGIITPTEFRFANSCLRLH
jgi:uncharacterized protein Usg